MGRLASAILAVIATPPLPTMASAIARLHAYSAGVRRDASRALPQRRQTCQHAAAFQQDLPRLAWTSSLPEQFYDRIWRFRYSSFGLSFCMVTLHARCRLLRVRSPSI